MEGKLDNNTAVGDRVFPLPQLNENLKRCNKETGKLCMTNEAISISSSTQDKDKLSRPKRFLDPFSLIGVGLGIVSVIQNICSDSKSAKNFDKVFDGLNKNYEAINKNYKAIKDVEEKVDRNFLALILVSKMVSETLSAVEKTRLEMQHGFNRVLDSLRNSRIEPVVSKLNSFIQYFASEKETLKQLPENQIIAKLQDQNNMLLYLRDARTPKADSLHSLLYDIIHQEYAIPQDANDKVAFAALYALYYGTQTYISVMFFLLDQYSFLADYHYQRYDTEKYNEYFDSILTTFQDFKHSLVGSGDGEYLIQNVIGILRTVKNQDFVKDIGENSSELISERMNSLTLIKHQLEEIKLPLIVDVPEKLAGKPMFTKQVISTPIGDWKDGAKVSYAIQYRDDGTYSRVGEWSDPLTVSGKANPSLRIAVDPKRRTRLIFRKFNNDLPQLVGVLENKYQTRFRDINRDLFNAASTFDENIAIHEVDVLVQNGADVNAIFDKGRCAIHAAAQGGNTQLAREFLLNNNTTDVNRKDSNGYSPIHIAAETAHEEFIELLIEHGADVNARTNSEELTALHIAAYKGDVLTVEALFKSDAIDVNARERQGFSPLHSAVVGGFPVVRVLMSDKSVDINAKSSEGLTPLHLSSINNYFDIAEILLESDEVDINARANGNLTALHFASMIGNLEMVRLLNTRIETDVNVESVYNWTPLHFAVSLKREVTVSELLKINDTNVNKPGEGNITALHIAAATGQVDVVLNLLEKEATLEARTIDGLTALHLASMYGNLGVVSYLVDDGANVASRAVNDLTPLHVAAQYGHLQIVKYLIDEKGADFNIHDNDENTLLHVASRYGKVAIARYLIEKGADISGKNKDGNTSLHLAAKYGSIDVIKCLLEDNTINVNEKNNSYLTPLFLAVIFAGDKLDVVKYLISKGASILECDNYGRTIVHYLALYLTEYDEEVLKYFIENERSDAIINKQDNYDQTALHLAIEHRRFLVAKYLIEKGADVNCRDKFGNTPLQFTVIFSGGKLDVVKSLISKGASILECDNYGRTIFHYLALYLPEYDEEILKYFIENEGADSIINKQDNYDQTALHLAIEHCRFYVARYLIEKGADVNCKDKFGNTPLHLAVRFTCGKLDVVKSLISKGASILGNDNYGQTVFHYLVLYLPEYDEEILKYFIENEGANAVMNKPDDNDQTALHLAIRHCKFYIATYLIEKGADVNCKDKYGNTPLHLAVKFNCGKLDVVKSLISKRASILGNDNYGRTLFHYVVLYLHEYDEEVLKYFTESENAIAVMNKKDNNGETPVYLAVKHGKLNAVKYLSGNGADFKDKSLLELANEMHHFHIVEYLKSKGAGRRRRGIEPKELPKEIAISNYDGNTPVSDELTQSNEMDFSRENSNGAKNGATKSYAWINIFTHTVKCISGFITSPFKAAIAMEQSQIYNTAAIENADMYGTLLLLDVFVRKITGQKHISTADQPIPLPEAQACALIIREELENIMKQASKVSKISFYRLDVDFVGMQNEIMGKIMGSKFGAIPGILSSYVDRACPGRKTGSTGKLSQKKFERFLAEFNSRLDTMANEPMEHVLSRGRKLKRCNLKQQQISLEFKNDFNDFSDEGRLTEAKNLMLN